MQVRDWVALLLISAMVATCGVVGVSYVAGNGWPIFNELQMVILSVAFTVLVAIVLLFLDISFTRLAINGKAIPSKVARNSESVNTEPTDGAYLIDGHNEGEVCAALGSRQRRARAWLVRVVPRWSAKSIILFSAIMALFWLPWLIANYPGGTYWDTYYQIYQVYPENHPIAIIPWAEIYDQTLTDAWLVDHHPIFTTLVYGAFGWVSDQLTGNWMAGVFLFVCIQGVAHIVAFTAAVAYMRKLSCPLVLCLVAYGYFCIMPFVSTWAMCMVKDSFFGLFIVPYFIMLAECVRTRGKNLESTRTVLLFALCALMLCLTKKTGLFVVIPTCILAMIVYRKKKTGRSGAVKGFLAQGLLCVIVMCLIFPFGLFPLLNVVPGGKQEVLGPLFQQTARYVVDYGDEVTPEEYKAIAAVIDYAKLEDQYVFDFEDSIKYRYDLNATTDQLLDYLRVYVEQGIKHPDSYFAAIASLAGFYVAPTSYANIRMVTVDTKMGPDDRYMLWNPDGLDDMRLGMEEAYIAIGETPVVNFPLLVVLYVLWIPAALIYTMLRRRLKCGILFVPSVVLLAFCVIAPVFDARYAVPIFNISPLLICVMAVLIREKYLLQSDLHAKTAEASLESEILAGGVYPSNADPVGAASFFTTSESFSRVPEFTAPANTANVIRIKYKYGPKDEQIGKVEGQERAGSQVSGSE